jgi:hypothetical protein
MMTPYRWILLSLSVLCVNGIAAQNGRPAAESNGEISNEDYCHDAIVESFNN